LRYFALQSTVTAKNYCTVKLNSISVQEICQYRINNYLQTVLVQGKIAGPGRRYLFIRVANIGDFPPKKANFVIFFDKRSGLFFTTIWTFEVFKRFLNLGWQHCFHRTSTLQRKVPQNARSGEPYTFYILK
jgi:hypothetical protein